MKGAAQFVAHKLNASGVLRALERFDRPGKLRALCYHRIGQPAEEPDLDPSLISASPQQFRQQMELLASHYQPVSLDTVRAAQRGQVTLPPGAFMLTFDDGYLDFGSHAWPVLRELGLPAVLFVSTAFPGQTNGAGFWWDRLYAGLRRTKERQFTLPDLGEFNLTADAGLRAALRACKQHVKALPHHEAMNWVNGALQTMVDIPSVARVLDWDELRKLKSQGLDICCHGHSHALCTRLTADELREDLTTSLEHLQRELGNDVCTSVLAWPANDCSPQVCEIARSLGFELGFGGVRGVTRVPAEEALDLMRVPVLRYPLELFRAQLRPSVASLGRYVVDTP